MIRSASLVIRGALVAASVMLTMAMDQREFPAGTDLPNIEPAGTLWIITQAHQATWMPSDQIATIEFTNDDFFGQAPCNTYRGPRQERGLSPFIMSTRRACDQLKEEGQILGALKQVTELRFNACHGVGLEKDGHVIASFYRVNPPKICETTRM